MSHRWPRVAGHEYPLTPDGHGEALEWRHVTSVLRRPHERLERMRRHLNPIRLGPLPTYAAERRIDKTDEQAAQRFFDAYSGAVRRRLEARRRRPLPGDHGTVDVMLVEDPLRPFDGAIIRAELRPPRESP